MYDICEAQKICKMQMTSSKNKPTSSRILPMLYSNICYTSNKRFYGYFPETKDAEEFPWDIQIFLLRQYSDYP